MSACGTAKPYLRIVPSTPQEPPSYSGGAVDPITVFFLDCLRWRDQIRAQAGTAIHTP
jgi:hypothetical protein